MSEIQDWQECEAMGHVGPVRDHTTAQSQIACILPVSVYADMGGSRRDWARVCTRGVPKGAGGR
jgi:hypothetical protein